MWGKSQTRLALFSIAVFVLAGLTLSNYLFSSKQKIIIESPGDIEKYVIIYTKIPLPVGLYVSGRYGDSRNCRLCDGFIVEQYRAILLGGFGVYATVRIQ